MRAWIERHRFALAITPLILAWLHLLFVFVTEARDDSQQWLILVLLQVIVLFVSWRTWASPRIPDWIPIVLIVLDYLFTGLLYPFLLFAVRFSPKGGWTG
jgi:hypothetical protein